ncbi:hypothetical protein IWW48_002139 [Coemansia sp. RSA 1200]|nr:hypothetical protein IWW48_002139 [Coemansia sp. RSA 1200]
MTRTIAIIGATGTQGGSVLRVLHATGKYNIIAVTRDASSASANKIKANYPDIKLAMANLDNVESLKKAFKGADIMFGVTQYLQPDILSRVASGNVDAEFHQGKNVVDAAIAAEVKEIVFSTMHSLKELSNGKYYRAPHYEGKYKIETYIFAEFARISAEDNIIVELAFPLSPTTQIALVDAANDTGNVVSYIPDNFDEYVGTVTLVSGGYYEVQYIAKAYTEATGKPAHYVQLPYNVTGKVAAEQMFRGFDEFGSILIDDKDLEINKKLNYKHTTPVVFKSSEWTWSP